MGETNIFKVWADSQRRDILTMLKNGRLNAGEIAEELQITPAALSYHLRLLKSADLVSEYKEKNFVYYEINTTVFDELIIWVNQFGGKKVWKKLSMFWFFCFIILFIYRVGTETKTYIDTDIWIGSGDEWWGW